MFTYIPLTLNFRFQSEVALQICRLDKSQVHWPYWLLFVQVCIIKVVDLLYIRLTRVLPSSIMEWSVQSALFYFMFYLVVKLSLSKKQIEIFCLLFIQIDQRSAIFNFYSYVLYLWVYTLFLAFKTYAIFTAVVNLPIMKIVEPFENKNIYDQKN